MADGLGSDAPAPAPAHEPPPHRLDVALVLLGLARSRTHAARLIDAGVVTVDGVGVVKPSHRTEHTARIEVAGADHYVSRAAHKLVAALDGFGVDVSGRSALDVGASTGGFTQVLLERGAVQVIAVDVGHAQLAPSLRSDDRVTVVEGFNARAMTIASLADAAGVTTDLLRAVDLVVADLSFISLGMVLPAVAMTVGRDADIIALVKPQFEVGRGGIREGVVRRPELRTDALNGVLWGAWDVGLRTVGVMPSPLVGTNGNHEYLVRLSGAAGSSPSEWSAVVDRITA
ncbi:MAG: hypothetical protein RI885_2627 [Actinomycetota bacterium]